MPHFSVIIPTYNRAHLLPMAIESVLQQSFEDFEIVISNGGSTDNTGDVVKQFSDPRIKYFESAKRLSVGDNYQTGLENASGEYITFLSDDDAFSLNTIKEVEEAIRGHECDVLVFKSAFYFDSEGTYGAVPVRQNSLVVPNHTGEVTKFSRDEAIKGVFSNFGLGDQVNKRFRGSYLANAVYHRSVLTKISQQRPKVFDLTPADGYLAAAVAFAADSYYCWDKPLHVWTDWAENATATAEKKGDGLRNHYESLLQGNALMNVPLKFALPLNCTYNSLLTAKDDFTNEYPFDINWADYYFNVHQDLMFLKRVGVKIDLEVKEWHASLSGESPRVRDEVQQRTGDLLYRLKNVVVERFPRLATSLRRRRSSGDYEYYLGNSKGFENVLESARFLTKLL